MCLSNIERIMAPHSYTLCIVCTQNIWMEISIVFALEIFIFMLCYVFFLINLCSEYCSLWYTNNREKMKIPSLLIALPFHYFLFFLFIFFIVRMWMCMNVEKWFFFSVNLMSLIIIMIIYKVVLNSTTRQPTVEK